MRNALLALGAVAVMGLAACSDNNGETAAPPAGGAAPGGTPPATMEPAPGSTTPGGTAPGGTTGGTTTQ